MLKDHLNKVEYFCLVAEAGSIKKATEKAFIGQPQLTKVVKQLEDVLEVELFIRSSKGVVLTKAGAELYKASKQILKITNESEFSIKSGDQKLKGSIKIGTYDSIARYFFPDFLKYFRAVMPELNVFLETGRSSDILEKLSSSQLDIAVVVDEENKTLSSNIQSKVIYKDSFGLYQSPSLTPDFKDKLIYFDYGPNKTKSTMRSYGFDESVVCDNLETVKSLTEQSIGVGLLPHKVAKEGVLSKRLIPYNHSKIKGNTFDHHNIMICYEKKKAAPENQFVFEEIQRFLDLWSKN